MNKSKSGAKEGKAGVSASPSHLIDARRVTLPDGRIVSGASAGDGGPQVPGTTNP